jgi:hypothetical protein
VDAISGAIDLSPTLHALAQIKRQGDQPLDGRSLAPLLLRGSQKTDWPERTLFQTWGNQVSARTEKYRLDQAGNLFDMVTDPNQTTPIQAQQPGMTKSLVQAVQTWRSEMGLAGGANSKGKAKAPNTQGNAVDPRPIAIGYREFPTTMLPARDGEPLGELRRSARAPNSSYFTNWTKATDAAVWNVEVMNAGTYVVTLDYTCPNADVGATLELSLGATKITGKLSEGWDPPLFTQQDIVPRTTHGESLLKPFKTMTLGEIKLEPGLSQLKLRATVIPGKSVMDLRRITLTLR